MVFGATGYIARWVSRRLREEGHELFLVHRSDHDVFETSANVSTFHCRGPEEAREAVILTAPDVVLNLANFFSKNQSPNDIAKFSSVNCDLVTELAFGCVEAGAVLFHVGSAWQATFDADDPSLGNPYALYKGMAVQIIEWFQASFGLSSLVLNLYDTYGPLDPRGKIIQFLVNQIGSKTPLELSGGEQILELVHVADVANSIAEGMKLIGTSRDTGAGLKQGSAYWCYPNEAVTLRDIVSTIDSISGQPILVEWGARPYRVGENFSREIEHKDLVPGWVETTTISQGLAEIVKLKIAQSE